MLGSKELAMEVGKFLKDLWDDHQYSSSSGSSSSNTRSSRPFVVLDPVMISTSGHKLIEEDAKAAIVDLIFPYVDIVTPNKFEAEELLGRSLNSFHDIERGAKEILDMGVKSVLIKGGHVFSEDISSVSKRTDDKYAQDYFLSKEPPLDKDGKERICDGCRGVWLRTDRYDSVHTHGTGCTLSSVIASALAIGHQQRSLVMVVGDDIGGTGAGAATSIYLTDACVLAKAYITAGVASGVGIGQGPGPVVHTAFPSQKEYFPSIVVNPQSDESEGFLKMQRTTTLASKEGLVLGKLLPIVDSIDWIERLVTLEEITDIQLRIKGETDESKIQDLVERCQNACERNGVRLWINDFWKAAVKTKCFGVHLGQEDLARCLDEGGLEEIRSNGLALGISTHSYAELATALGIKPSYISLGPIFGTKSKNVAFDPQGLETVRKWRELIGSDVPLVAIGGINDVERAKQVKWSGADCVAVIGAVQKDDIATAVKQLGEAMS
jgi:thiamine-phosphate diphosphorylase